MVLPLSADEDRARKVFAEIYRPLYLNKAPILYTSRRTAELIKYAANARSTESGGNFSRHGAFADIVCSDDGFNDTKRHIVVVGRLEKGAGILRKTRASKTRAGVQKF
jgi:hypothetical protein